MGLLIVGGGLAAQRCIEVLRAAGDDRPVTVVSGAIVLYDADTGEEVEA